jgi:hypothetical protein
MPDGHSSPEGFAGKSLPGTLVAPARNIILLFGLQESAQMQGRIHFSNTSLQAGKKNHE